MSTPNLAQTTTLPSQQYAMRLLQMLEEFGGEMIRVETIMIVVKMLTRHTVENAVIYTTGDAFQFGAVEYETGEEVRSFLGRLSENVALAAMIDGEFEIYKYPYRSQVMDEWVFIKFEHPQTAGD
jgi:hypothetical protein